MGSIISYQVATHTSPDKFEIDLSTQTSNVVAFAFDPTTTAATMLDIKQSILDDWAYTKGTGTNQPLIFETRSGNKEGIYAGQAAQYFGFISHVQSHPTTVYWIAETGVTLDYAAADAEGVFTNATNVNSFQPEDNTTNYPNEAGSGDPHIRPLINPYKLPLVLPVNNKIYNYFYYQSPSETVIINAAMWCLSGDRIVFAEELRRDMTIKNGNLKTDEKERAYPEALENITKYPVKDDDNTQFNDVSFIRYLSIVHKTNFTTPIEVVIDLETLEPITSISHPNFVMSNIKPNTHKYYVNGKLKYDRTNMNSKFRDFTIKTETFGNIMISPIRDYDRLNHRNSLLINIQKNKIEKDLTRLNVQGALIHPDRIHTVPTLQTTDFSQFHKEPIPELLSDYNNRNKDRLKQRRFQIRDMVRNHDFSLLDPPST